MKTLLTRALALILLATAGVLDAQVPNILNYQGRVAVGTPPVNFDGLGQFKFALVNSFGGTTYWSNDGSSTAGSQPTAAVTLTVTKGLYSVQLGDTALTNMTAIPASVFNNADVRLCVWFNDGTNGFQLLMPVQRIAAVGYAIMAGNVADGSITRAKIAEGAVNHEQIATGAVSGEHLDPNIIINGTLNGNALTATMAATADKFSGPLVGDVTGTQGTTVVATVGGVSAANVASGVNLVNAATSANTPGTIVLRDASGNFTAGTITATGGLALPTTSSASVGVVSQNGSPLIHSYGSNNFFAGQSAGNFTLTGIQNIGIGFNTLRNITTGNQNTAVGWRALAGNTTGNYNTASGQQALVINSIGSSNTAYGARALASNTTAGNNIAIGESSLQSQSYNNSGTAWDSNNVAVGSKALYNNQPTSTLNGINNSALGNQALYTNTTGYNNTACGEEALYNNSTGYNNTACGYQALYRNTTGFWNTACGQQALSFNTTGLNNTALGQGAISSNSTGSNNTASGVNALYKNTTGTNNTASGNVALNNNTTGSYNTASGNNALLNNTTGNYNIGLGVTPTGIGAGSALTTGDNNIDIGNAGVAGEANTIRIGTTGAQTDTYLTGVIHGNGSALTGITATSLGPTRSVAASLPAASRLAAPLQALSAAI